MAPRKRGELLGLLRPCFVRAEPWLQAGKYVGALVSDLPKRNGWTIAQQVGDRAPLRTQRLLNRAVWDTFAAMRVVRRFAVAGLDEAARRAGRRQGLRVGAIDETSQVKQGTATAGVKRQYLGWVGKVANGITTVHLSYVREQTGHALIGARQWIPAGHLSDPVKLLLTGLPPDLRFRTKGQLAIDICAEARADGARFDFLWAMRSTATAPSCARSAKNTARDMCCGFPLASASPWRRGHAHLRPGGHPLAQRCSPLGGPLRGAGSKGQRWYGWVWLGTASPRHYLLIRRHLSSGELAFHYCYVPAGQPVSRAGSSAPLGSDGRQRKISSSARAASASISPRSASITRSPATPCWSWPHWQFAP